MAKKFMYVCLGLLMLAIAYHLAAPVQEAQSQEEERPVLMAGDSYAVFVMTDRGNMYRWNDGGAWSLRGAWPGNPPTLAHPTTWSQIKAEFGE